MKKVKYDIGVKADLGGDEDEYDLETSRFGNENQAAERLPDISTAATRESDSSRSVSPARSMRPRDKSEKPSNFMEIYQMQMMQAARDRRENRRDKAEDHAAMIEIVISVVVGIGTGVASYMVNSNHDGRIRRKQKKKRMRVQYDSSSDSSEEKKMRMGLMLLYITIVTV